MKRCLPLAACLFVLSHFVMARTAASRSADDSAELKYVVYVSRHGVRSPTAKVSQYSLYSTAPWPTWDVPPGYLTKHGYGLMKIFGGYDRMQLAHEGLLSARGCGDANSVTFYADSSQRTRETGKALAEGLFPGCNISVQSLPEGTNDPLFHPAPVKLNSADADLAVASIAGRIGDKPENLTDAYRNQLAAFDDVLSTCSNAAEDISPKRFSLMEIPSSLSAGKVDRLVDLRGPLNTAATLSENLLLEYTEGMDASNVGWGCVDGSRLRSLIDLHTAASDFTQRTPAIAKIQASNLLDHINRSLEQAMTHHSIAGAQGKPSDRALFLIGHDTNLSNVSGLLNLNWIADGRRDDTPPGSAFIFELWKDRKTESYSVRIYFTTQTLEQMRSSTLLTLSNPPIRTPIFIPGCSRADYSCTWSAFSQTLHQAVDSRYVY